MLENPSDTKSDSPDTEFEEVKSGFTLDGYPKLVDITKRLSCSDASTIKPEYDEEDDEDTEEPMITESTKSDEEDKDSTVTGNETWDNRNYRKRLKLRHLHGVDGVKDKANLFPGLNAIADIEQMKQRNTIIKTEEENDDNNNSNTDGNYEERDTDNEDRCTPTPEDLQIFPPAYAASLPPSHVTFEALQNTRVAVAQHIGLTRCPSDPEKLQELAAYLHQQYILQMKMIHQRLQEQMETAKLTQSSSPDCMASDENEDSSAIAISPSTSTAPHNVPISLVINRPSSPSSLSILTPPKPSRTPTPIKREPSSPPPASQPLPSSTASHSMSKVSSSSSPPLLMGSSQPQQQPVSLPPCSISSSFASSIITNLDPPPSPSEPNSLEILTKHTQEILDNASQGLLANNLADELAFRKGVNGKSGSSLSPYDSKNGGRNEPFFKHRCRYCGKVFGSDSALQIHIRSHTGERPFKCNVCGSRFTTKGNLKVHFQRHTSKFPHIKMNPHPVPEHLDKFHPPLLAQMGSSQHQALPPGLPTSHAVAAAAGVANIPISSPGHPQPAFPIATTFPPTSLSHLYRSTVAHPSHALSLPTPPPRLPQEALFRPLSSYSLFGSHINNGSSSSTTDQDQPENLCKPATSVATNSSNQSNHSISPTPLFENGDQFKEDSGDDEVMQAMSETSEPPNELSINEEGNNEAEEHYRSHHAGSKTPPDVDSGSGDDASLQEQPENLSNKSRSEINDLSLDSRKCFSRSSNPSPRPFSPSGSSNSSDSFDRYLSHTPQPQLSTGAPLAAYANDVDPSKDPSFVYANFLPQPGSNDNSWENLIEIDKTSETSKLQELVDNIGHKLTDPNECVICHRILSCKSALQMHYRTHTGERPFRCKLCRRSFTTKGNLKTHMSVHRVKPPVRVHHQCPVCHKRFTNSLILEQHIRLHTGDPTDLTLEQIQASEIREYFPGLNNAATAVSLPPPPPLNFSPLITSVSTNTSNTTTSIPHPSPSSPLQLTVSSTSKKSDTDRCDLDKEKHEEDNNSILHQNLPLSSPSTTNSTSLVALENHVQTSTTVCSRGKDSPVALTTTTTSIYHQSFPNPCNNFANGSLPGDLNDDKSPVGSRSPAFSEQMSPQSQTSVPSPTISTTQEEVLEDGRCSTPEAGPANGVGTLWSPLDLTPKASSSSLLATSNTAATTIYTSSGHNSYNHVNTNTNGSCSSTSSTVNATSASSAVFVFSTNSTPSSRNTSPLISSVLTSPFNPLGLAVASSGRRVLASSTIIHCYHSTSV